MHKKALKVLKVLIKKQGNSILPKFTPTFVCLDNTKILFKKHWGTFGFSFLTHFLSYENQN